MIAVCWFLSWWERGFLKNNNRLFENINLINWTENRIGVEFGLNAIDDEGLVYAW